MKTAGLTEMSGWQFFLFHVRRNLIVIELLRLFVKYGGKFKIAIKIRCMKMHLIFCHVEANRILFLKLSKFRYP